MAMSGPRRRPRSLQFTLFLAATLWYLCARTLADGAASAIAGRIDIGDFEPLADAVIFLLLVVSGLALLRSIEQRKAPLMIALGLPGRATAREEWGMGAAMGWGLAAASVIPMALGRSLNVHLWTAPRAWELMVISLLTLAVMTLAQTLAVFGYGFQRLIEATGPVRATMVLMALGVLHAAMLPTALGTPDGTRIVVEMLSVLLLCLCWLRTHGLWLGWGLHFAWAAATAVLFGLPVGGDSSFASVVDTRASGPLWLTGGVFGPTAAAISILLLVAAIPVLVKITSEYAWNYTHPPLIPAGYPVEVAAPAAHTALEQDRPSPVAPLVQILPASPSGTADDGAAK